MFNMKKEEISDEQIEKISRRISELSEKEIDRLFHDIGFIVSGYKDKERPEGYEALFPEQIEKVQNEDNEIIRDLLFETDVRDVIEKLKIVEKE